MGEIFPPNEVENWTQSTTSRMYPYVLYCRLCADYGIMAERRGAKELADGIMELRITFGGNITRVLYFFVVGNTAVLTNAFVKKTQRTPPQEIVRAQMYRDDYQRRHAR